MRSALFALTGVAAFVTGGASASDYVYTPVASAVSRLTVEAATGTRDAGTFGGNGTEGLAAIELVPARGWTVALRGGVLDNRVTGDATLGYGVEARFIGIETQLGGGLGYRYDYEGVAIPYGRLTWTARETRYPLAVSAIVELPQAGWRDAADLILSAGQTLPCFQSLHCGLEAAGEDLEGFWDETEAEGGAKFVIGPTLAWARADGAGLRAFAGWIHAGTTNQPTRQGYQDYQGSRDGFMLRLATHFGM